MAEKELSRYFREIVNYAKETANYSYYDLYAYAYTDKNEWLPIFQNKKTRYCLNNYLKSAKHSTHTKYKSTMEESMEHCVAAEEAYQKRQGAAIEERKDSSWQKHHQNQT